MRFRERLRDIGGRPFVRGFAVVVGGTAAAQLITVLFSPLITRQYGPEPLGLLGAFMALSAMIAPAASLAYGNAINLPKSDVEACGLLSLSFRIIALVSMLVALVVLAAPDTIAKVSGLTQVAQYLPLLPIAVGFAATEQALRHWLIRMKDFSSIAQVSVRHSLILNGSKGALGLVIPTPGVLITTYVVGLLALSGMFWAKATRFGRSYEQGEGSFRAVRRECSPRDMRSLACKYRDFPLFRAPQVVLSAFSLNLPVVLFATLLGAGPAGLYAIAKRVLELPVMIVAQSMSTVILPRIAETVHRGERTFSLLVRTTGVLMMVGIAPFGLVMIAGPAIFGFVFGSEWVLAGEYGRWLAVWLFFSLASVPATQAIPFLGLQAHFLAYELAAITIRVSGLAVGALVLRSDTMAVMLFSVSGALLNALLILYVLASSGRGRPHRSDGAVVGAV